MTDTITPFSLIDGIGQRARQLWLTAQADGLRNGLAIASDRITDLLAELDSAPPEKTIPLVTALQDSLRLD